MKVLETERLLLRPWKMEDLTDFYTYCRDPEVGPNAGWKPHESMEESRGILEAWIAGEEEIWALEEKGSKRVIGSLGLHNDRRRSDVPDCKMMGYALSREFWGKGFMPEAVSAVMDYAFTGKKLKLLTIYHYPNNSRSCRVIEKCGFRYEGTLRCGSVIYDDSLRDDCCYSMTAAEYYLMRAKQAGFLLVLPEKMPEGQLLSYAREWSEEKMIPGAMDHLENMGVEAWLERSIAHRIHVPAPLVTETTYLFLDSMQRLAGALSIRHMLNDALLKTGGHIGYGIRPSCRGKGWAPYMLALGLEEAKKMGLERVLITCLDTNLASAATIEACGGILDNKIPDGEGALNRRYWISL